MRVSSLTELWQILWSASQPQRRRAPQCFNLNQLWDRTLGEPDWACAPRLSTQIGRTQNEEELDRRIGDWTKDYPSEQIMAVMQGAGVS